MERVVEALAQVSGPLAVAGLLASILFYVIREIIRARLIPALPRKHALPVVLSIINKLFILSLVALVLGLIAYVLERSGWLLGTSKPRIDIWMVKVYDFENHGAAVKHTKVGERFSGLILDALLRKNLDALATPERPPGNIGFETTRGPGYEHIQEEFAGLGPSIAVVGFVEDKNKDEFVAHVRVSGIATDWRVETLLVEEIAVSRDNAGMKRKASDIAEAIYDVAQKYSNSTEVPHNRIPAPAADGLRRR